MGAFSEPDMSDRQATYIEQLMDRKLVTARTAERIILLLQDCDDRGSNGLSTPNLKVEHT